jgi:hypothetical protein
VNDADLAARLRTLLRAHVVADPAAPVNYSLQVAAPVRNRRGAGFYLLYRGSAMVLRTRDPRRLVNGLLLHLESDGTRLARGQLAIRGLAVVRGDRARLAPPALRPWLSRLERRLNLRGWRVVDTPWVLVDAKGPTVVVPQPRLDVDPEGFAAIETLATGAPGDPPVPTGRYWLTEWVFLGDGEPMTRAQAVAIATRFTLDDRGMQTTLTDLATVMRAVEPTTIAWGTPPELVAAITEPA